MPQDDPFAKFGRELDSPATQHFAITPADGVDLPVRPRVLYVLTDGNLVLRDADDVTLTYPVTAGQIVLFSAVGVEATDTTATVAGWV